MRHFGILLAFVGIVYLELIQPAFAHGVHCGLEGCRVGAFGITDWSLAQIAFDNMFYISIILYGAMVILFWFSLLKRKHISTIVKN